MYWSKKHDEFCMARKITANSALLLFKHIVRRLKSNSIEEIEIDLKQFNKWIERKRGRGYDPKTLKDALDMICDRSDGMVVVFKRYTWYCQKLIVKPLAFFERNNSHEIGETTENESLNGAWRRSSNDEMLQQQQQNLNTINNLAKKVGLNYDHDALLKIWRLAGKSVDRVIKAIELMLYRNHTAQISKPHGFLIECLKRNWQEGFDLYYQPELPRFRSSEELQTYALNLRQFSHEH